MTRDHHQHRRRWFQFGIGTLLIFMTCLAAFLGYAVNWIHQRHAVLTLPGVIGVTEVGVENVAIPTGGGPPMHFAADPQPAPWPLSWLHEQGYIAVVFAEGSSDAELVRREHYSPKPKLSGTEALQPARLVSPTTIVLSSGHFRSSLR